MCTVSRLKNKAAPHLLPIPFQPYRLQIETWERQREAVRLSCCLHCAGELTLPHLGWCHAETDHRKLECLCVEAAKEVVPLSCCRFCTGELENPHLGECHTETVERKRRMTLRPLHRSSREKLFDSAAAADDHIGCACVFLIRVSGREVRENLESGGKVPQGCCKAQVLRIMFNLGPGFFCT